MKPVAMVEPFEGWTSEWCSWKKSNPETYRATGQDFELCSI